MALPALGCDDLRRWLSYLSSCCKILQCNKMFVDDDDSLFSFPWQKIYVCGSESTSTCNQTNTWWHLKQFKVLILWIGGCHLLLDDYMLYIRTEAGEVAPPPRKPSLLWLASYTGLSRYSPVPTRKKVMTLWQYANSSKHLSAVSLCESVQTGAPSSALIFGKY